MKLQVSLLLLTYNRKGVVMRCMRSLKRQIEDEHIEVLVVDNGSTDGTAEWVYEISKKYNNFDLFASAINLGVSGGRDFLLRHAKGEYLVFLDSDVVATNPLWLDVLLKPLIKDESIGICGPAGHFLTEGWKWYEQAGEGYVDTVSGFCQAFRRRDVDELGLAIDLDFGIFWHEDTAWCLDYRASGKEVWCTGDIGLMHLFSGTGDAGDGIKKQQLLASKYQGRGLVRHERIEE